MPLRAPSLPVDGDPRVVSGSTTSWVSADAPSLLASVRRLAAWPGLIRRRWDLVAVSVRRDLQARFRGTLLGFAWVLAHPLLLFAVYAFIFTHLLGVRLAVGEGAPPGAMGVYMFTGTLCWSAFADAVQRSTSSVVDNRNLVQKVQFPSELLPLQVGLSSLVTLVAGVAAFVVFTMLSPVWPAPGLALLVWAPVLLFLQLLLTTGLGLALSAIHVLWRDTLPLVGIALTVGLSFAFQSAGVLDLELSGGSLFLAFVCGAIAVSAMILPGISGSFVMLVLGQYMKILAYINERSWQGFVWLGFMAAGCVGGLLAFSRLLNFLLRRWRSATMAFLIGLVLGSFWVLWPFKDFEAGARVVKPVAKKAASAEGEVKHDVKIATAPHRLPESWSEFGRDAAALVVGLACAVGVELIGRRGRKAPGESEEESEEGSESDEG